MITSPAVNQEIDRISMGCSGLNDILGGGLPINHFYLLEGDPGAGKTTLALQFCAEGLRRGETVLYVTLSESTEDLLAVARSHDLPTENLEFFETLPDEKDLRPEDQYSVFHPAEIELNDRMQMVIKQIDRVRPQRLVIDALSELRMLAHDPLRYRRQILSLKDYVSHRNCTTLLLDDRTTGTEGDLQLHSIVHGVISLEKLMREYGASRRQVEIMKLRGTGFREGFHDYIIQTGGVVVFPRLVAAESRAQTNLETVPSGVAELDALVGGGLERGTSTLVMGPAGCGKTTISVRWAVEAAERGEHAAFFIFEEGVQTLLERAENLGMNLKAHLESGRISIERIDPAALSPGEFVHMVRTYVVEKNTRIIVVDSLNGYLHSMPGENFLAVHLHELLMYLNNSGVLTFLVLAQLGMFGAMPNQVDVSYLADNILLLRYFEAQGAVRQAISIVKKRSGAHEHTIRELRLGPDRIHVGSPLSDFHGILTGVPQFVGSSKAEDDRA